MELGFDGPKYIKFRFERTSDIEDVVLAGAILLSSTQNIGFCEVWTRSSVKETKREGIHIKLSLGGTETL